MNNNLKDLLYLIIAVIFGALAIRFLIWILPLILIGIGIYLIYRTTTKNKKAPTKKSKKDIKIIDMVGDE